MNGRGDAAEVVQRLGGRKWPVAISTVKLGCHQYRVVRPARAPRFAGLYEGRLGAQFCLDKETAVMFAQAWGLAARSPRTIVYLPLRHAKLPADHVCGRPLDMVLLHHRLAFPPSRWKQVRSRLGSGRPHTFVLPDQAWPSRSIADHRQTWHQEFRDHLRWDIAADTLVLTGSREAFELQADQVRALAEECPAHRADNPGTHCCAEIGIGRNRRNPDQRRPYAELHAEYAQ